MKKFLVVNLMSINATLIALALLLFDDFISHFASKDLYLKLIIFSLFLMVIQVFIWVKRRLFNYLYINFCSVIFLIFLYFGFSKEFPAIIIYGSIAMIFFFIQLLIYLTLATLKLKQHFKNKNL